MVRYPVNHAAMMAACLACASTVWADLGFGPGHASSFMVSESEKALVVGVSGLTWSNFTLCDYKGQGYLDTDKKNQQFRCFVDSRLMDVEKKSDKGTDYDWCGLYSEMQALLWGGYLGGHTDEDEVADILRKTGSYENASATLNGLTTSAAAYRTINSLNPTEFNPSTLLQGLIGSFESCNARCVMDVFIDHDSGGRPAPIWHSVSLVGYALDSTKDPTDPLALKGLFVIDSDNSMYDGQGGSSAPDSITYCPVTYESYGSQDYGYPTRQYFKIRNVFGTLGIVDQIRSLATATPATVVKTENVEVPGAGKQDPAVDPVPVALEQIVVRSGNDHYLNVTGPATVTFDWQAFGSAEERITCVIVGSDRMHVAWGGDARVTQSISVGAGAKILRWWYTGNGYGIVENIQTKTDGIVGSARVEQAMSLLGCVREKDKVIGSIEIKIGKEDISKGSKITGSVLLFGGKKQTVKAKDNVFLSKGPDMVTVKVGSSSLVLTLGAKSDGSLAFEGTLDGYAVESANVGGEWTKSAAFGLLDGLPSVINGGTVNADYSPDGEPVTMAGKKWTLAKAASIKYAKDKVTKEYGWVVNNGKDDPKKTNLSGLKLTYTPKTGAFKGSFAVYTLAKGKMKKVSATVNGIVVDGVGHGMATIKNAGSYAVTVK